MRALRSFAVVLLVLAGCSGPATPPPDPDAGPGPLLAPMPPALPVLTPCAAGWREQDAGGVVVCEPWSGDRAPDCAADELALPGVGCEHVDTCPEDGWPTELPASGVLFVRSGAEPGGDGTRERPFATLAEAATAARGGNTIALAAGEHEGNVEVTNVDLVGACATGTHVRTSLSDDDSAGLVALGTVSLRGLHLSGGYRGLWIGVGGQVTGRNLVLEGPFAGLRLDRRARFVGERVRIAGATERDPSASAPPAVSMRGPDSALELRRSTVVGGARSAIQTSALPDDTVGSSVLVEDSAILETFVGVTGGARRVEVRRCALERMFAGVAMASEAHVLLEDVYARDLQRAAAGLDAYAGALVVTVGPIEAYRVSIARSTNASVVAGAGSDVRITDLVARTIESSDPLVSSSVIAAEGGASVHVARAHVSEVDVAVYAQDGARIVAEDLTIASLRPGSERRTSAVVVAERDGEARLERVSADLTGVTAAALANAGGHIEVIDMRVRGGWGLHAQCVPERGEPCPEGSVSSLAVERVHLSGITRIGVSARRARATMRHVLIESVAGAGHEDGGYGILVDGGECDAERVEIRGATLRGVAALAEGARVVARQLDVDATAPASCDAEPCDDRRGGDAVGCALGATIDLVDTVLRGSHRAGLLLADGCAGLTLERVRVTGNAIGVLTDETIDPSVLAIRGLDLAGNVTPTASLAVTLSPPDVVLE